MRRSSRHGIPARAARRFFACLGLALSAALPPGATSGGPASLRAQEVRGRESTSADPRLLEAIDWYTGVAGRVDDDRARALLLEASDDEAEVLARMWLARVLSRGRMGFERDSVRAHRIASSVIERVRALAEGGDAEAVFLMGTARDEALGLDLNPPEAAEWYRHAAERGHVLGAHNLGNAYRAGRGVPQDDSEAVRWWSRAADAGDAIAQLRLGESYEYGRGVPRDLDRAVEWYRRAAAAGNAEARAALDRLGRGSAGRPTSRERTRPR